MNKNKKKFKIIMIDGFKSAYLKYAPYLSSLTKKYEWGELEMSPGHWGGIQILFEGKSDILAVFYRENGLGYLKYFKWLERFGKAGRLGIDILINFPRLLKGYELFRTGNIPLNRLYKFDISINKHFAKIRNVEFIYFGELDSLAHKIGIENEEFIKAIKNIDKKVSEINFDFIFSDHGMVNIKEKISVPLTDDCFVDGDMARYWGSEEELNRIKKSLPLDKGKILNWHNKKFGELIFLADTGVLIYPNFWDNEPSKAMHGYDGKDKEMKAFYMIKKEGKKKDLKVIELNKILIEMLDNGRQSS